MDKAVSRIVKNINKEAASGDGQVQTAQNKSPN
jgi:hypothetical protein